MNRRREPRFKPNKPAVLKMLGWQPGPIMNGRILDVSGSGIRLHAPHPAPCGESIEIDSNGAVSMGRVCRCDQVSDGYQIAVQVSHTVGATRDLDKLNRSLLGASRLPDPSHRS